MGRKKSTGAADTPEVQKRISKRLLDRDQAQKTQPAKKRAPPKGKKEKEVEKAKPEEEKTEEPQAEKEEVPAENGEAKAEESTLSKKMDNTGLRAVTRYLGLKSLSHKEVHEDMVATLGEGAPSYSMVKKWAAEFKCGTESLEDDPCPGRPVTVTTQETIDKIHDIHPYAPRVLDCPAAAADEAEEKEDEPEEEEKPAE